MRQFRNGSRLARAVDADHEDDLRTREGGDLERLCHRSQDFGNLLSNRFLQPWVMNSTFDEESAKEIRGLWRMEGYFMGGPFYTYSFFNPENRMQYMIDGYVYAPQFDKLPLLREVEAIAKSAKARRMAEAG